MKLIYLALFSLTSVHCMAQGLGGTWTSTSTPILVSPIAPSITGTALVANANTDAGAGGAVVIVGANPLPGIHATLDGNVLTETGNTCRLFWGTFASTSVQFTWKNNCDDLPSPPTPLKLNANLLDASPKSVALKTIATDAVDVKTSAESGIVASAGAANVAGTGTISETAQASLPANVAHKRAGSIKQGHRILRIIINNNASLVASVFVFADITTVGEATGLSESEATITGF